MVPEARLPVLCAEAVFTSAGLPPDFEQERYVYACKRKRDVPTLYTLELQVRRDSV